MNHFCNVKYMMNNILETNLLQNFASILAIKIDKKTNKYNKNKNQGLIILVIKFEGYNSQHLYK